MPDAHTLDASAVYCLREHGFYCAERVPGELWLFVPVGTDPTDGAPLTQARQASPYEVGLWRRKKYSKLASILLAQGQPVSEGRPWWRRLLGR